MLSRENSQETKDSSTQEILFELRTPSQQFNTGNHPSRKPDLSSAGTVLQVRRSLSLLQKKDNPCCCRLKRVQTLQELEQLGNGGRFQNKELPRPVLEVQGSERNPNNQPGAPQGKKTGAND